MQEKLPTDRPEPDEQTLMTEKMYWEAVPDEQTLMTEKCLNAAQSSVIHQRMNHSGQ